MIVMCKCGRVKTRQHLGTITDNMGAGWVEHADPDPSQPNAIMHHHCPECTKKLKEDWDREMALVRLGRFSEAEKEG